MERNTFGKNKFVKKEWMNKCVRLAAATAAISAGLGLAGLSAATQAQAQPGPFPQWCPGDFWDPGWGMNPQPWGCHDWMGGGPAPGGWGGPGAWGPGFHPGGPEFRPGGPGGPEGPGGFGPHGDWQR